MLSILRRACGLLIAMSAFGLGAVIPAHADGYPSHSIRLVVPFPPGGATDTVARLMADSMAKYLKQPIVVTNRGGAGAIIGAETVAQAEPDGYTILYTTAGVHVINPAIYPHLPYDPVKSFTFVGLTNGAPLVLTVLANSPFKNVQELIAYAKAHPGKLSYGSAGVGTSLNQSGEMFKQAAKVDILHVPYKGAGPALVDFLAGRVSMMFGYVGSALPNVKSGKVRILAIGSPKRLPLIPDVPTVGEVLGLSDYDADTWTGIAAPAGTPAAVVEKLNQAIAHALQDNKKYLLDNGYVILGGSPQEMQAKVTKQLQTLTPFMAKVMGKAKAQ
ncbi:Bug family tripartite tricarboxylate transporter substrate binding protein [Candidimonas nitroreducens]|uniref:LacI family transcriptional regulator n=1 Tax=Candidimonas nitroreducens TaxID=683354 RepID=A0A225MGI8_9BURK|nr:tripartite tricarboxylate transporter substrate binding protein [Candidimonas nitroreducens]OWT59050.1 hypothetical protein CEY11_12715 [Candidimonas nitroreducens]